MDKRIVAVISAGTSPSRRLKEMLEKLGNLVDAINGRRTRTFVVTDNDHAVLSSLNLETSVERIKDV